jgi:hypothetical protein
MSKANKIVELAVRLLTLHPPLATLVAVKLAVKLCPRALEDLPLITMGEEGLHNRRSTSAI